MICFKRGLSLSHFYKGNKWTVHVACAGDCHSWLLEKVEGRPGDCDWDLQEHNRESRVTAATYVVLPLGNSSFQVAWQFNLPAKQLPTREGAVGGWQLVYGIATELGCFFHTQSHSKLNNRQLCWKPTPLWQTWQIDANCMYVEYHI